MRDLPTQVCVHAHDVPRPPAGQRLPVFVLVSKRNDVIVIEGMPDYAELCDYIRRLAAVSASD